MSNEPEADEGDESTDADETAEETAEGEVPAETAAEGEVPAETAAEGEVPAETAAEGEVPAEEAESELEYGDFIRLDYTARTVEDGTLVDTTDPEVADEEGVGEDEEFAPRTIVLGEGHVFQPVEDDIVGKTVGDEGSVVVGSGDAFGEFDEDEVRTVAVDRIPEDDRYPGAHVTIDGEHGHVETLIGGRARVDFNHPLAGDDIEYEYEVLERVEDREQKAQALIDVFLDMDLELWFETDIEEEERLVEPDEPDEAEVEEGGDETGEDEGETEVEPEPEPEPEYETVEVEKETLYIEATPGLSMNQQWMMGKQQIADQLVEQLGVDRVIVQETLGEGMGMGMGGLGGMMGGAGGDDIAEALDDEDIDADEIVEELEDTE